MFQTRCKPSNIFMHLLKVWKMLSVYYKIQKEATTGMLYNRDGTHCLWNTKMIGVDNTSSCHFLPKKIIPAYLVLKWIIGPKYFNGFTNFATIWTQCYRMPISYNYPKLIIFCPPFVFYHKKVPVYVVLKQITPHISVKLHLLHTVLAQHYDMPLSYSYTNFFVFCPPLVIFPKPTFIPAHTVLKINDWSHICQWICYSWVLYGHNFMRFNYHSIANWA